MGDETRIGVVVVAYNAAKTLASVLDRIPLDFRPKISEVLVFDDHSSDETYEVGLAYKEYCSDLPLTIVRNSRNLGYGGNQKAAYQLAHEHGLEIVVLLHGDGQYAPESLPDIVAPLVAGECDAVMGSRMMESGKARSGGMPLYKYVGNRILTTFENRMLSMHLSEFHSGYRAFRVDVLHELPLELNSDGFAFDTQVIVQLHDAGRRIVEVPIPTYYGDEICYVNGLSYAAEISSEVARYRLAKVGFGTGPACLPARTESRPYELKPSDGSSHGRLLALLSGRPPAKVLDLGCSAGHLAEQARLLGHEVVGVDIEHHEGIEQRVDRFLCADLDRGIPEEAGSGFDVILAADVIEHVRRPDELLTAARERLAPGGVLLASVPNFAHWYPRLRSALGLFDYDRRGILDEGHVRFFTRRSFERLAASAGLGFRRREAVGLPLDVLASGRGSSAIWRVIGGIDAFAVSLRPQLFGYQLIYELAPATGPADR